MIPKSRKVIKIRLYSVSREQTDKIRLHRALIMFHSKAAFFVRRVQLVCNEYLTTRQKHLVYTVKGSKETTPKNCNFEETNVLIFTLAL